MYDLQNFLPSMVKFLNNSFIPLLIYIHCFYTDQLILFHITPNKMMRIINRQILGRLVAPKPSLLVTETRLSHGEGRKETPEEFNKRFIDFFNNPEIDGWFIRKGKFDFLIFSPFLESK